MGRLTAKMTDVRPDHGKAVSLNSMVIMNPIGFIPTIQWTEWHTDTLIRGDSDRRKLKLNLDYTIHYFTLDINMLPSAFIR